MTKKKPIFTIDEDFSDLSVLSTSDNVQVRSPIIVEDDRITIEKALKIITRQMEISTIRPRTIKDYNYYVSRFMDSENLTYVDEIGTGDLYSWLEKMDVNNQTKLTRLKCLKAFLSRCFDNGWISTMFWKTVNVKVDKHVKEGASERELTILMSVLNLSNFVHLRDIAAARLMFKTGIRISTLAKLEEAHIDFSTNTLNLDGDILKNRQPIILPFDEIMNRLLSVLIKYNRAIKREYGKRNDFVFITKKGDAVSATQSNNTIQKRLNKYSKEYALKNISPHSLRRGFAKSLLDKGARITDISLALGHSNLAVTSQYLHIDKNEVADNLRKFI
ncbi:tyrosine-type recombinase/integrase [Bacillus safensis]|uniref:tyrosine-type recombinase/integrase n=1 Tax=Bacillus safensis TaxID=561879 RepID=UPI0005973894|nr:site-specific integrase [Bacillus safensis]